MTANQVALAYLVASVLFILALKGLSSPTSARRGNVFGIIGMLIAVVTTALMVQSYGMIIIGIAAGGTIGAIIAKKIKMTQMPELVAAIHSLVGIAAVMIGFSALYNPQAYGISETNILPVANRIEMFIGVIVGAITFTGSVIAFGKLSGRISGAPVAFKGQHYLNLTLAIVMIGCGIWFAGAQHWVAFLIMTSIALLLGVLLIIPIGGADMPVVVSMLNSYSGWAAVGIGFTLGNNMLIIAGSLVGSSGAILSYIMCTAMNRSIINVMLGGFGTAGGTVAAGADGVQKTYKSCGAEDAAFLLSNSSSVIIVPGYGLAVARAQHALQEMAELLHQKGVKVRYAIHPVAGRMPGHMNVLLAEAEVPYDQVFEMDEINSDFAETDVALVIGANDIVNPAAKTDKTSPIYGMPILEVTRARTVLVNKRSMATGYAGVDNDLFYMDQTMMVFGDAKKVVEQIINAL